MQTNKDELLINIELTPLENISIESTSNPSSSNFDMNRLSSKERKSQYLDQNQQSRFVYIDYVFSKEDTLHSLSVKFSVNVSELKRINCLQNDRDIYALKALKIPIKPYSVLAQQFADQLKYTDSNLTRLNTNTLDFDYETLTRVSSAADSENELSDSGIQQASSNSNTHILGYSENKEIIAETEFFHVNDDKSPLMEDTTISSNGLDAQKKYSNKQYNKQYKEAKRYLKKMDNSLETLKIQKDELLTNVSKNEQLIPILDTIYSIENNRRGAVKISNLNLSVRNLLIFACFIVIIFPLAFYIYEYYYN